MPSIAVPSQQWCLRPEWNAIALCCLLKVSPSRRLQILVQAMSRHVVLLELVLHISLLRQPRDPGNTQLQGALIATMVQMLVS